MELIANVWPVADAGTGIVQRYFMRAYAIDAEDHVISAVLEALAPTDFRIAKGFKIAARFKLTSEHGTLNGAVPVGAFHENLQAIVEEAFRTLEGDYAKVQGIDVSSGSPIPANVIPHFPKNPYTVTTVLIETAEGQLIPQVER